MVYWFLSTFASASLQVLLEKLTQLGISAYGSISNVDEKLKRLERTLKRSQSLISDAEQKQLFQDQKWKDLLFELDQVAYDADDLIDEIGIKILKLKNGKLKNQNQVSKLLKSFYKHTSVLNLNDIQAKLDDLLGELEVLSRLKINGATEHKLQTTSSVDESGVVGREMDKTRVIEMLLTSQGKSSDNVSVISIIGMAGVGKTTLAQLVYNYHYEREGERKKLFGFFSFYRKQSYFDLKMWVSITEDFDVVKLTRSIIEAASGECALNISLEALQVKLKGLVGGKTFLLVLDDLQNVERKSWELLIEPLKYGPKGSKIIVTTRSLGVSKVASAANTYELNCLSSEDCWSLLKEEALGSIDPSTVPELEKIGISIAMKCKGLPLAAKNLGTLLHSIGVDEIEWYKILESKIFDLIVPDLGRGYHPLPSHVKQCFAYCSLFPQSYVFEKDKIIQMWIGEGFVMPNEGSKMVEDIGKGYFDQLWKNSFFQVIGGKYYMHDAVREFAQSVSGNKFFRLEKIDKLHIDGGTRHLSMVCDIVQTTAFKASYNCKGLRTFLLLGHNKALVKEVPDDLFQKWERLRLLDLSGTHLEELAGSVGNLKHLRFLDLSNTFLKWLPEDVKELCVLQVLRLRNCSKLLYLPKNMSKITSLQHLELGGNSKLTCMPSGIGKLTCLQTIRDFVVGSERGQLMELKNMNKIQGSLCIKQLEKVSNQQEAVEAKLEDKEYLDTLELQWTCGSDVLNNEDILDKLKPHQRLKELILRWYGGKKLPTWISDPSFSSLTSISLYNCENCGLLPALGKLPKLKSLKVVGMLQLILVDETFVGCDKGFKSLETLEIREMFKLESWVGLHENDMERLCELKFIACPRLKSLPSLHHLRSLKKLEFESCPSLVSLPDEGLSGSIDTLIILDCTLLENCCQRDVGEDWLKIEHIPCLEIGVMQ